MKRLPFVAVLFAAVSSFADVAYEEADPALLPAADLKLATARYVVITNALARGDERSALFNIPTAKKAVRGRLAELECLRFNEPDLVAIRTLAAVVRESVHEDRDKAAKILGALEDRILMLRLGECDRNDAANLDQDLLWSLRAVQSATNELARGEADAAATDASLIEDAMKQRLKIKEKIEAVEGDFVTLLDNINDAEQELLSRRLRDAGVDDERLRQVREEYAEAQRLLKSDDLAAAREHLSKVEEALKAVADDLAESFLEGVVETQEEIDSLLEGPDEE